MPALLMLFDWRKWLHNDSVSYSGIDEGCIFYWLLCFHGEFNQCSIYFEAQSLQSTHLLCDGNGSHPSVPDPYYLIRTRQEAKWFGMVRRMLSQYLHTAWRLSGKYIVKHTPFEPMLLILARQCVMHEWLQHKAYDHFHYHRGTQSSPVLIVHLFGDRAK